MKGEAHLTVARMLPAPSFVKSRRSSFIESPLSLVIRARKLADLDVSEGNREAVVLEQNIAVVGFAKVRIDLKLAGGDSRAERSAGEIVFQDSDTVQPVFTVWATDNDAACIPLTDSLNRL